MKSDSCPNIYVSIIVYHARSWNDHLSSSLLPVSHCFVVQFCLLFFSVLQTHLPFAQWRDEEIFLTSPFPPLRIDQPVPLREGTAKKCNEGNNIFRTNHGRGWWWWQWSLVQCKGRRCSTLPNKVSCPLVVFKHAILFTIIKNAIRTCSYSLIH